MVADVGVEAVSGEAADVEAVLRGLFVVDCTCRTDPDDRLESGPILVVHPYDGVRVEGLAQAHLYPPVPLVHVRVLGCETHVVAHIRINSQQIEKEHVVLTTFRKIFINRYFSEF